MYWLALQSKLYCEVSPSSLLSTLQHLTPVMSHSYHSLQSQQKNSVPKHNLEANQHKKKVFVIQAKLLGYCKTFCFWKRNPQQDTATAFPWHASSCLALKRIAFVIPWHTGHVLCISLVLPATQSFMLQVSLLLCLIPRASFEPGLYLEWQIQEAVLLRYRRTSASEACSCFVIINI